MRRRAYHLGRANRKHLGLRREAPAGLVFERLACGARAGLAVHDVDAVERDERRVRVTGRVGEVGEVLAPDRHVVREASRIASNWRSEESLESYLKRWNIVAIEGIDTRALVRHIRDKGAMRSCLSTIDLDEKSLVEKARQSPRMENRELASVVTTREPYEFPAEGEERFHIVCFDFGVKRNSLRELAQLGVRTTVVPSTTTAADALALKPDGIFLSNGPGDPASMNTEVTEIQQLLKSQVPIFGICFGHQLLGRAFGASTFKLVFGHRGGNQPVKELSHSNVEITSHNHGFAVSAESLPPEVEVTHINLNDQCVEGMRHRSLPVISVQYHPEAAPGPHDAEHHFQRFVSLMEEASLRKEARA